MSTPNQPQLMPKRPQEPPELTAAFAGRDDIGVEGPTIHENVVILNPHMVTIHPTARIDSFVKIEGGEGVIIGPYVHIASFAHIGIGGGKLILEEGAAVASHSMIVTGSNVPAPGRSCSAVAHGAVFAKSFVKVCKNATLFAGAIVLPGVTIGEGACVGAGAVVKRDIPAGELWAGNPAVLKKRVDGSPREVSPASAYSNEEQIRRWIEGYDDLSGLGR